jgi:hypothetical protein
MNSGATRGLSKYLQPRQKSNKCTVLVQYCTAIANVETVSLPGIIPYDTVPGIHTGRYRYGILNLVQRYRYCTVHTSTVPVLYRTRYKYRTHCLKWWRYCTVLVSYCVIPVASTVAQANGRVFFGSFSGKAQPTISRLRVLLSYLTTYNLQLKNITMCGLL